MVDFPPRYECVRELGAGGMGRVYLVRDRDAGDEVALKAFAPAPDADLDDAKFLFKQEFWALASLTHPNLVAARDYGELPDGRPYFTMEYVPGADLAPGEPMAEATVRAWLPGVIAALGQLHARGFVHGDLKPENIRMLEGPPSLPAAPPQAGRQTSLSAATNSSPPAPLAGEVPRRGGGGPVVKLMDLGLLTRTGRSGGPIRGSLRYMAPEAIRQGAVDGRADLYALGAVLHHMLAGNPPFEGSGPLQLLRAHLQDTPAPLGRLGASVSPELEAAVLKLLAKEPAARFATAGELARALGLAAAEEAGTLLAPPIVGREAVQVALADLLVAETAQRRVLVGPAGSGKSRLLAELRADAQLAGVRVLAARGLGTDAAPYEALLPWLRALAVDPPPGGERLAPVLVRVLPDLARRWGLAAIEPAPALEGAAERLRLEAAIAELAAESAPAALWLLDDADRLDPASRALVDFLVRAGAERAWRWVEAAAEAPAHEPVIALPPLDADATLRVASAMLGQPEVPAAVAEHLPALAAGVPGAIEAILGHWTRMGALHRVGERWVATAGAEFDLPGGLAVALDDRFEGLPEDARRLARIAALVGDEGELPLLAALAGLDEGGLYAALAALSAAEVLAYDGSSFRFVTPAAPSERAWSARARRLAASWELAAARPVHLAAATWLARGGAPELAERPLGTALAIARHHLAAAEAPGDHAAADAAAAAPWVLATARRAMGLGEPARAGVLLDRALALEALAAGDRLALARARADALRLEGRVDEALALAEGTVLPGLRETGDPALAHELASYGLLCQMKGRYADARAALGEAIPLAETVSDVATAVRARASAGRVAYFSGEGEEARALLARAVADARAAGLAAPLAGALGLYGYLIGAADASRLDEALALLDEAVAANQAIRDAVEELEALTLRGNLEQSAGRLEEAEAAFAAGLAIGERMGLANETIFARVNLGAVALERGHPRDARVHGHAAVEMSRAQGRKFPLSFGLAVEGLAAVYLGEVAEGLAGIDAGLAIAREIGNRYVELAVAAYRAEALVEADRLDEAAVQLEAANDLAEATGNDEQQARLARVARAIAEREAAGGSRGADERVADGRSLQLAGLLASISAGHGLAEVMHRAIAAMVSLADAERGFLFLYNGAEWTEQAFFGMAAEDADAYSTGLAFKALWSETPIWVEDAQADPELAERDSVQALALRSVLGVPLLEDGRVIGVMLTDSQRVNTRFGPGELELAEALARHAALAIAQARRIERLEAYTAELEAVSRAASRLAGARSLDEAFAAVAHEAMALCGAERALLLAGPGLEPVAGRDRDGGPLPPERRVASESASRWVYDGGEPLHVLDAQDAEGFGGAQSIMALGLRTIFAAPVAHEGTCLGVLYLDDRRIAERDAMALGALVRLGGLLGAYMARG